MDLTIVIPICNEWDNLPLMQERLKEMLANLDKTYEILYIDDGSTDGSQQREEEIAKSDPHVRVIQFRRNYGQTAALQAGFEHARGDVIIMLDGDLQNDPADIPMMLEKIDQGYDLVHGWRQNRQDTYWNRKLPSKIANWLISKSTGFPVNDLGCSLKAIRREIAQELEMYGEMHRFIPILAHGRGARCLEVVTRHHARQFGQTKYGLSRTTRVMLDLVTAIYMIKFFRSPMKLFGKVGLYCFAMSMFAGISTLGLKLFTGFDITGNPLFLLTAISLVAGIQFLGIGLLGEVLSRIYYSAPHRKYSSYTVRKIVSQSEESETLRVKKAA